VEGYKEGEFEKFVLLDSEYIISSLSHWPCMHACTQFLSCWKHWCCIVKLMNVYDSLSTCSQYCDMQVIFHGWHLCCNPILWDTRSWAELSHN
jgi:hypothetical protein